MTEQAAAKRATSDPKLDARILQLILKGQLRETSAIADQETGTSVLLADHPHFAKVLHLARVIRSVAILKNVSWWTERTPEWASTLGNKPLPQLLFETSRAHKNGFLTLRDGERAKVVAFSAGLTVCVGSNLTHERLGEVMVADKAVTAEAMAAATAAAEGQDRCLDWALLDQGLLQVDDVLGYYELQAHQRLFDLFAWRSAELGFHADERAVQLENVVNLPLLGLLRTGLWQRRPVSADRLRELCTPLTEHTEPLRLWQPLGTLQYGLTEVEGVVFAAAKNHAHAVDLAMDLERMGPEAVVEGLRFLYTFTQVGVIGVEAPEHAQPILEELEEVGAPADLGPLSLPVLDATADAGAGASAGASPSVPKRRMTGPVAIAGAAPLRRMTGSTQLKEYRLQLELEAEGRRLLNAGQYTDAVAKFRQLAERQERPVQALAYQAVAALLSDTPEGRVNCGDYAKRALELDKQSALANAAMARVLAAQKRKGAELHERRALALSQENDAWFIEVRGLLDIGQPKRRARSGAPALAALLFFLLVGGGLFAAANVFGLGAREYFYSASDRFFFIRRGALLLFGILGLMWVTRTGPLRVWAQLRFNFDGKVALVALLWGVVVGFLSPSQRVTSPIAVVYGLTVLHVVAEEVFFRGFVTRALLDQLDDWQRAVPISALIYAVYHLTYYSFWFESDLLPKVYWCGSIGLFAGFPYALMYARSKGLTAPLLCHLVVNGVMMTLSFIKF